jgi:hypothetical protein
MQRDPKAAGAKCLFDATSGRALQTQHITGEVVELLIRERELRHE